MENIQESIVRPFAVVTAGSTGVGYELAKKFAQNGFDLLIASDSEAILEAQDALEEFGTDIECMEVNLATYKGVELLTEVIRSYNRPVDVLMINARSGIAGEFVTTKLRQEINLINCNLISAMHLTKNLLKDMQKTGQGKILFTTSTPTKGEAVHSATTAFLNSFADTIRRESKDHGITVTVLNTRTDLEENFEHEQAEVARQGFEALMAGASRVSAGSLKTKLQGWATRIFPERITANFHKPQTDETLHKH